MTNVKINTAVSYIFQGENFKLGKNSKMWSKSFEDAPITDTAYVTWREKFYCLTVNSRLTQSSFFNLLFDTNSPRYKFQVL